MSLGADPRWAHRWGRSSFPEEPWSDGRGASRNSGTLRFGVLMASCCGPLTGDDVGLRHCCWFVVTCGLLGLRLAVALVALEIDVSRHRDHRLPMATLGSRSFFVGCCLRRLLRLAPAPWEFW